MLNRGVYGLREVVIGEASPDRTEVYVKKRLRRPLSDAAIPPGQSIELSFYSVGDTFSIKVQHFGWYVSTDERRNGALQNVSALTAPAQGSAQPNPSVMIGSNDLSFLPWRFGPIGEGWRILLPEDPEPVVPPEFEDEVIPFDITLTDPQGVTRLFSSPLESELLDLPWQGNFPAPGAREDAYGLWNVSVLNTKEHAVRIELQVTARHSVVDLQTADLPLSLMNTLAATALKKASVTIAYHDGNLVVQTPTHFLDLAGVDTEFDLPSILEDVIDSVPTFTPLLAAIESQDALVARLIRRRNQVEELLAPTGYDQQTIAIQLDRQQKAMANIQDEINRVQALGPDLAVFCLVLEGMFTGGDVDIAYAGRALDIENEMPQIAYIFDRQFKVREVMSTVAIDLSPLLLKFGLTIAALTLLSLGGSPLLTGLIVLGGLKLYNSIDIDVEGILRERLVDLQDKVEDYMTRILQRVSGIGAVLLDCELVADGADDGSDLLRVNFYDPASSAPPRPWQLPPIGATGDPGALAALARAGAGTALTLTAPGGRVRPHPTQAVSYTTGVRGPARQTRRDLRSETPGDVPGDFVVGDPNTLNLLDRHEMIVIVMMENRSFDHFFFELSEKFPNRNYEGPPVNFTNPAPPGFGEPFKVCRNDTIGVGNTLIINHPLHKPHHFLDPGHSIVPTLYQIGGGTCDTMGTGQMQGFTRDFATESNSPQVVMSYFGLDSLPTYRTLIEHFTVCDRWFASLPVGTQPNRLAAFQGNVPFVRNLHRDDPSLGFLEDYSLFDLMDSQDIPWLFFEGDIGTIRLYDRYRLNVKNVRPFSELRKTLREASNSGNLPRVVVIEPEFLYGNDDHPPMDIRDGQDFIKEIIGQFIDFSLLDRVLIAITYDEHGGFFDHVPPPGTPEGDNEGFGPVANMFPQDPGAVPACMGVRVPSIVTSKFISAEAKSVVLDHTSILKTVLLHNRHKVSTAQFSRFGDRVKEGAHLGQLMDRVVPRDIDLAAIAEQLGYSSTDSWFMPENRFGRLLKIVDRASGGFNPFDPARVLHHIAAPRARRFVSG